MAQSNSRTAAAKKSATLTQNRKPSRRTSDAVYINSGDSAGQDRYHAELDGLRRRRYRKSVILPFGFVLLLVLVYIGITLALPAPTQVAVISNAAFSLLVLCPAALCLFPLAIAGLVLVGLMQRWQSGTMSPLRRLERWAAALESNADRWLGSIDQRILDWAVAFAPIRQLLRSFDTLSDETVGEEEL
ncbi:MAG: hypothetical protein OXE52_17100 [Chloroflexi bacterium]|nr:hypothetical protein [Chloroflexota bacterium]